MTATIEFTKRFYKEAKGREFTAALAELRDVIKSTLLSGPAYHKKRIIPLSHTTKRNLWRIRANIQPAPYRLFFEWITNGTHPILRVLTFVPKKHRYCDPKHSAEIEKLGTQAVDREKHAELEAKILGTTDAPAAPARPSESKQRHIEPVAPNAEPTPLETEQAPSRPPEDETEQIIVEPAAAEDLLDIYATRELIEGFASLHGYSADARRILSECSTTDQALGTLDRIDVSAKDRFIEFLLDQDSPNDLERFYRLSGDDFTSIPKRPLSSFLLAVDDEQQQAIDRPITDRPFMIRGSAGTGKSVVCLYRLRRMIEERMNETLFDVGERPSYLFVTYTNSLVESSRSLFEHLGMDPDLGEIDLRFSTLDGILKEIARNLRELGESIPVPDRYGHSSAYWGTIRDPSTPGDTKRLLEEIGLEFFAHEIDEVLVDRDVTSLSNYLEKGKRKELRKGLIVPLREDYRQAIWVGYQRLLTDVANTGKAPFSLYRRRILEAASRHPAAVPTHNVVIADEIQDLGDTQLQLITKLAKSPAGLLLAKDAGQTIYRRQSAISTVDPALRFNSQNSILLKRSYRMTWQNHQALTPLREEVNRVRNTREQIATPVYTGPKPMWIRALSDKHYGIVVEEIHELLKSGKVNPGQFAILFSTNEEAAGFHSTHGDRIPCAIHRARIDVDAPYIHLLTAHSSKGLEFPHVYIPHATQLSAPRAPSSNRFDLPEQVDSGNKLLYVAGSRASDSLTILQESNMPLGALNLLKKIHWNFSDLTTP